jgi:hypothetical protein
MNTLTELKKDNAAVWRRQCLRNLLDGYAHAMDMIRRAVRDGRSSARVFDECARLFLKGIERLPETPSLYYEHCAAMCERCAERCIDEEGGRLFLTHAALFRTMA